MRCPFCGHDNTSVKDSRLNDDQSSVKRRRACSECGSRFTTFERPQLRELYVIKKNGERVLFDRDKLLKSIKTAMHKRQDPEKLERIVSGIVRQLETTGDQEISTQTIGELVMKALMNLDTVAYVRFASIYKHFHNVEDFTEFLKGLDQKDSEAV